MKKILLLLSLQLMNLNFTIAQGLNKKLDSLFTTQNALGLLNGNVLVAENGKILYQKSFGYADLSNHILNNDQSVFLLASVSKTMTTVAVLQLVERRFIKLDDSFKKYFPDFPYADIKIRNLLSHTSGLPRDKENVLDSVLKRDSNLKVSYHNLIPALIKYHVKLNFVPGEKYEYSNVNYNLLAVLVEKISKLPFEAYIRKNIFLPAKMSDTYLNKASINPNKNQTKIHNYPKHYSPLTEIIAPADKNYKDFFGQGNIVSSTTDLLKFDQALYGRILLKSNIIKDAYKPTILNDKKDLVAGGGVSYGLGWMILQDTSAGHIVFHTGGVSGIRTVFFRNLTRHQTVIILDNSESGQVFTIGINALNILNKKEQIKARKSAATVYCKTLFISDPDAAMSELISMKADTLHYIYVSKEMDIIGKELLTDNFTSKALEVFKINLILNPKESWVYTSYGKALLQAGKKQEAISIYKNALVVNPNDKEADSALGQLLPN
jgi:CubicO group peptidase (beta-lactamase class C family)